MSRTRPGRSPCLSRAGERPRECAAMRCHENRGTWTYVRRGAVARSAIGMRAPRPAIQRVLKRYQTILPECNGSHVRRLGILWMYGACNVRDRHVPCRRFRTTGARPGEVKPSKRTGFRPCATHGVGHAAPIGRDEEQLAPTAPITQNTRQAPAVEPHLAEPHLPPEACHGPCRNLTAREWGL